MKLSKQEILKVLTTNTQEQPKAVYSNAVIERISRKMYNADYIEVECTKQNKNMFNRGVAVEIMVKMLVYRYCGINTQAHKSECYESDMNTLGLNKVRELGLPISDNIEIKFATSFANATPKKNTAKWVLLINQQGAYLVSAEEVATVGSGHIKPKQPKAKRLNKLSDLLGF